MTENIKLLAVVVVGVLVAGYVKENFLVKK